MSGLPNILLDKAAVRNFCNTMPEPENSRRRRCLLVRPPRSRRRAKQDFRGTAFAVEEDTDALAAETVMTEAGFSETRCTRFHFVEATLSDDSDTYCLMSMPDLRTESDGFAVNSIENHARAGIQSQLARDY